ncbi:MAG TPA: glycosyltransferase, partial [Phycisphaerales bacterium]|nr:glycosyltransferase [Phycisphaerales bacterium]
MSSRESRQRATGKGSLVVVFAGGGSGGHISPGLAIAERLAILDPNSRRIFLCSQRTIDSTMLTHAGAEYVALPATPPSASPVKALSFWRNFRESKSLAYELMLTANVSHVVALGGFVAAPVVAAAYSLDLPVTLVNLDARPGKANRWIAKRSTQVLSAVATPDFPNFSHSVIGMPVRR